MTPEQDPDKGGDCWTPRFVNRATGGQKRNAPRLGPFRRGLLLRGPAVLVRVILAVALGHLFEMGIHLLGLNGLPTITPRPAAGRQAGAGERGTEGNRPRDWNSDWEHDRTFGGPDSSGMRNGARFNPRLSKLTLNARFLEKFSPPRSGLRDRSPPG